MKSCSFTLGAKSVTYFAILLFLGLYFNSCQEDNLIEVDNELSELADDPRFNEDNYQFATINLWGSEAAVIDAGDYYIFQTTV